MTNKQQEMRALWKVWDLEQCERTLKVSARGCTIIGEELGVKIAGIEVDVEWVSMCSYNHTAWVFCYN